MTSKLGCHWLREHPDKFDFPHIEAMQYRSIKPFKPLWDNRDACANLLAVLPKDSYILARDHSLSEQKEGMWSKPEEHGKYHADEWANKVRGGIYHLPTDRTFFLGINEPDATNGDRNAIDIYTAAFLERLQVHGLRGGAFNFSTGHPRTVDGTPNTQADYTVFERSHQAIVRGNHIGVLHIYGTGAVPCAPGHYDRLRACDWQDVEWVVGEFGVDEHVIGGGPHDGFHKFFNGRLDEYCGWLDSAIMGINDPRIHSYQVFTYDFSHPWDSFDTHPIRSALERFDWQHVKQAQPIPSQPPTPPIKPGEPTPAWVAVTAGANIRSQPKTGKVLIAVPYGDQVAIVGYDEESRWFMVRYRSVIGWMMATLLSHEPVEVQPTPQPEQGDKWSRTINFILKEEGGFTANDEGAPANFGINQGANPDLDVKNITREQAIERYRTKYWIGSGADQLDFPFCLLVMDASVQHGESIAKDMLEESGGDPWLFQGIRQLFYSQISKDKWQRNGKAWMARMGRLLVEAAK